MGNKNFRSDRKLQQRFERREERKFKEGTSRSRSMNDAQIENYNRRMENERQREVQRQQLVAMQRQDGVHDQAINADMDGLSRSILYGFRYGGAARGGRPNPSAYAAMADLASTFDTMMMDAMLDGMGSLGDRMRESMTPTDPDWWKALYPDLKWGPTTPNDIGKFDMNGWVMSDKQLVVLPYPARLSKMREDRPEDYAVLVQLLDYAGMTLMSDEEARSSASAGRTHDIVLAFGQSNLSQVRHGGQTNVLPMAALVRFAEERIRRSPFLLRRTMAEKSMQPVARKVNLDG